MMAAGSSGAARRREATRRASVGGRSRSVTAGVPAKDSLENLISFVETF